MTYSLSSRVFELETWRSWWVSLVYWVAYEANCFYVWVAMWVFAWLLIIKWAGVKSVSSNNNLPMPKRFLPWRSNWFFFLTKCHRQLVTFKSAPRINAICSHTAVHRMYGTRIAPFHNPSDRTRVENNYMKLKHAELARMRELYCIKNALS